MTEEQIPFVPSANEGRSAATAGRASSSLNTNDHRTLAFSLAGLIFLADQFVKWLVIGPLALQQQPRQQIEILPFFNLTWVENYGVSLGMLTANSSTTRWLLVALTTAIAAGVAVWIWREKARADALALSLVLGGALGNIVDRMRFGYVVDYADLHIGTFQPFLVFNVADAAITIGVLLLLLRALLTRDKKATKNA